MSFIWLLSSHILWWLICTVLSTFSNADNLHGQTTSTIDKDSTAPHLRISVHGETGAGQRTERYRNITLREANVSSVVRRTLSENASTNYFWQILVQKTAKIKSPLILSQSKDMDRTFRMVVPRYLEMESRLLWMAKFNHTIYNRGRPISKHSEHGLNIVSMDNNVGRESYVFLHHIIENYDHLENVLVFCQAHEQALENQMHDLVYAKKDFQLFEDGSKAFAFIRSDCLPIEFGLGLQVEKERGIRTVMSKTRGIDGNLFQRYPDKHLKQTSSTRFFRNVLEYLFDYPIPDQKIVELRNKFGGFQYVPKGCFAVTREAIWSRSIDFYRKIIKYVSHSSNPAEGYLFERAWPFVFNVSCAVSDPFSCQLTGDHCNCTYSEECTRNILFECFHNRCKSKDPSEFGYE